MFAKLRGSGLLGPMLFTLPALALLLGLGTWQMQRKAWKDGLIAAIQTETSARPVDLYIRMARMFELAPPKEGYSSRFAGIEYSRISATGVWDHSRERHLYAPDPKLGPGYHVFAPLLLRGRDVKGITLMVNRGFVPEQLKDANKRREGLPAGEVAVTGLARTGGAKGAFTPVNDVGKNIWFWPDLPAMSGKPSMTQWDAAEAPGVSGATANSASNMRDDGVVLPFFIDAEAEPANPGGWPRGGTTNLNLPNRHLEYALTWYGLAATLVGVLIAYAWGRLRQQSP